MPRPLTDAAIEKQLRSVQAQLASARCDGQQRLALLRRQAQLGDERDAAVLRARRARRSVE